jgi:hypothetical protein
VDAIINHIQLLQTMHAEFVEETIQPVPVDAIISHIQHWHMMHVESVEETIQLV